ncbi:sugar ABC transporter permease [Martelella mediterranea]|uniref:carbohydrate ABC transporter permease n=1 Tax=Martelella mediterranea TaxID=293089 RepID=UPI001E556208|nr:sugar ABC transporter permease [Martelella mediterranea]MCD1636426.1 sugar ABC transporter permease [Martelella mediterranea]
MTTRGFNGYGAYVAPTFLLLGTITVVPLIITFIISLFYLDVTSGAAPEYQGFYNYISLFSDSRFLNSLKVTAALIFIPVALQILFGLTLAIALREKLTGTRWMRLLFLLPAVIPPAVSGLVWKLFVIPGAGGLSYLAALTGASLEADLLSMPLTALGVVIAASTWVGTPFVALLLLSGLETISKDQYESATIDGATWMQCHRFISVPTIMPIIRTVMVFRILEALAIFPIIFVLTGGGPAGATSPINFYAYVTGFDYLQIDYAASIIVMFFLVMMTLCTPFLVQIAKSTSKGA